MTMPTPITLHLIFHAHLDPIWLWPWSAGVDEALATCRSACDRLDNNPDIFFTQGEAWVYKQIEDLDPALFTRIKQHVAQGRWEITGGWWTQPDCNAPDGDGFKHQIQAGKDYFLQHFKVFPDTGFCPDSFGHNAALPALMRAAGQKHYIMMRPQEHELALPARLFTWRGEKDGPDVTTFRIAQSYNLNQEINDPAKIEKRLRSCCEGLPDGVHHSMCFCGVGDHGGGPTENAIRWLRDHATAFAGLRLVFSTTARFFAAIADDVPALPTVTGELQHHAIGCYTVHRESKMALQQATQRLSQVENAIPELNAAQQHALRSHWQNVAFHQFHDTLGGTCIPSAYRQVRNQLGAAEAWGEEQLHHELRKKLNGLPDDPCQRLIFFNASDRPCNGLVECEPWLAGMPWHFSLRDHNDREIPCQLMPGEALIGWKWLSRLALRLDLAPGEIRALRLVPDTAPDNAPAAATNSDDALCVPENAQGLALSIPAAHCRISGHDFALPALALIDDPTDTWSHGIDRYPDSAAALPSWGMPVTTANGPLFQQIAQAGRIGSSDLFRQFRVFKDRPDLELLLRITWQEKHRVLKLVMPIACTGNTRIDATCAGASQRQLDGKERPIQGWTALPIAPQRQLAVLCPDVFALDATPQRVRFTLLRSPLMAHHLPHPGGNVDGISSDRGEHVFRFRFSVNNASPDELWQAVYAWLRPPLFADLTRGMPPSV